MPRQKRHETKYPGVYFILARSVGSEKREKIYYIRYRQDERQIDEKVGRQSPPDAMTPAKAAALRVQRIRGEDSNRGQREKKGWTLTRLWDEYAAQRERSNSLAIDEGRFALHIKPEFENRAPDSIRTLDVDKLRGRLSNQGKSPQTIKHILGLIKRLINFGIKKGLIDRPEARKLNIEMPHVDNEKTEDLSQEQLIRLFKVLAEEPNQVVADVMRFALATGMRRGEITGLKWTDVNFERESIFIKDPKGGKSQSIPMNAAAREILARQAKKGFFIFCSEDGQPLNNGIYRTLREIKKKANIPAEFRPLHGLRHVFASNLASSGKVDLYVIQKLLTHKSATMTRRYSHLRDEALRRGADVATGLFGNGG